MRVLILTVSAGYGHTATAKSIEQRLIDRGIPTECIDVYQYVNKLISETIDKSSLLYAKYTPEVYRLIYQYLDSGALDDRFNLMSFINALCTFKFEKLLREVAPEFIICTHVFAAQLVHELKKKGRCRAQLLGICTDYTIHPYWETLSTMDHFIIASEALVYRAVKKGIRRDIIHPFGIPVHPKFYRHMEKDEARRQLGFESDSKVVLLMGGGLGYGLVDDEAGKILSVRQKIELAVVCGNNHKQQSDFERLRDNMPFARIHVYGFVDNVHEMMDAADILVSKPGGLTVTEALLKGLPMVVINPIAGHEERNLEFLLNQGACVRAERSFPLDEAIAMLLNDSQRVEDMKRRIDCISKPNAGSDLVDLVARQLADSAF